MGNIINLGLGANTFFDRSDTYKQYESEARKYKLLSADEENALMAQYAVAATKEEKIAIRNKIIQHNQRFVIAAAKQYANQDTETFMNLVNEANIGFIEAFESFDPNKIQGKGRILSWAAYYIRRAINAYLIENSHMVKQSNKALMYHQLAKARNILAQRFGREATEEELITYFNKEKGLAINDIRDVRKVSVSSVDTFSDDEDNFNPTLAEFNNATGVFNTIEVETEHDYNHAIVKKALSCLSEKEQEICKMLYGLNDSGIEYSIEAVADKFDYTGERIRQIRDKCLQKMARAIARANAKY